MNESKLLKERMLKLTRNWWWTWHPEAIDVWRSIDSNLWRESRHSPSAFLKNLGEDPMEKLYQNPSIRIKVHRALSELNRYLDRQNCWG